MTFQHKQLSEGRWNQLRFIEQMANVGSEVDRSINWRLKHNDLYTQKSFERALELIDLTIDDAKNKTRLREIARMREALVDFFIGTNEFSSTEASWRKYFFYFTYASRKDY